MFYGIAALGMDDHRALLGLLLGMPANFDQGLDHPFESIDLIVPHDKMESVYGAGQNIGIFQRCRPWVIW